MFKALGTGPGDECITTTNTFFATAEAIWLTGPTVVFVDSDPRTNCIDPNKIDAAITAKTKLLVSVHLYGPCANMSAIRKIADKQWAARYTKSLTHTKHITLPYEEHGYYHVYHLYVIETKEPKHRDVLPQHLNDAGIDAKCHYPSDWKTTLRKQGWASSRSAGDCR